MGVKFAIRSRARAENPNMIATIWAQIPDARGVGKAKCAHDAYSCCQGDVIARALFARAATAAAAATGDLPGRPVNVALISVNQSTSERGCDCISSLVDKPVRSTTTWLPRSPFSPYQMAAQTTGGQASARRRRGSQSVVGSPDLDAWARRARRTCELLVCAGRRRLSYGYQLCNIQAGRPPVCDLGSNLS